MLQSHDPSVTSLPGTHMRIAYRKVFQRLHMHKVSRKPDRISGVNRTSLATLARILEDP